MSGSSRPRSSLKRAILGSGMAVALAVVLGSLIFIRITMDVRDELVTGADRLMQEQAIANDISRSVMRQLAAAAALSDEGSPDVMVSFDESGARVYGQIRSYLFLDLSPEARSSLEQMREEHQRLEVLAARTADLFNRGSTDSGRIERQRMIEQSFVFLESMDEFLDLREAESASLRGRQDTAFQALLLGGLSLALFLLLGALVLARVVRTRLARPLGELSLAAERLADGDLGARAPDAREQEIHTLATAFNRMAASLQEATGTLEDRNRELEVALEQVEAAQAELIRSERLSTMGRMTAGLAHELNNPLASVLGFGELLSRELEDSHDSSHLRESYVVPLVREAVRARHLIRNLLSFAHGSDLELSTVSIQDTLTLVIGPRQQAFRQAGLDLLAMQLPAVHVRAEPQMLQSVFLNLVNNALDAMTDPSEESARSGTELRIRGHVSGDTFEMVFEDEGPGFTDPQRAFEPFYTTKPVGRGTGLGLSLVRRFVESFGGSVSAENRPRGGASVLVRLPLAASVEPVLPQVPAPSGPSSTPGKSHQPRILVVEDEEPLRRLQTRILERLEAHVLLAGDAPEARRILEEEPDVDLVISDIRMPGESGLELHRAVSVSHPDLAHRFLFVTGDVSTEEVRKLAAERPGRVLQKPFQIDEYLSRVRAALESSSPEG